MMSKFQGDPILCFFGLIELASFIVAWNFEVMVGLRVPWSYVDFPLQNDIPRKAVLLLVPLSANHAVLNPK